MNRSVDGKCYLSYRLFIENDLFHALPAQCTGMGSYNETILHRIFFNHMIILYGNLCFVNLFDQTNYVIFSKTGLCQD